MPSQQARAFWVTTPGEGAILEETLPVPGPRDAVVRTRFSGVSRGTESLVFTGRVPEGEHERMRAPFQDGRFPGPVKYGYAAVGEVEHGPAAMLGRTVFALYPHQSRFVIPADALHVIPDAVPPERAVLAANMETAVNGVWDAALKPGDRVTVVGAGTVGCLVAWLAGQVPGCEVCLVDVNRSRAPIAAALGVHFALPDDAQPGQDLVIHASGAPDGLATALALAGVEATVVEMSWFGTRPVTLALGGSFHAQRLTIRSSQVGQVSASNRARWDHRRRLALALSLLAAPALDALITDESALDDLPQVMRELATGARDTICHRIRY